MSSKRYIYLLLAAYALLSLFFACSKPDDEVTDQGGPDIYLEWHKAYDAEDHAAVENGLKWVFLNLGAQLPEGGFAEGCTWTDDHRIALRFDKLGFSHTALTALAKLNTILRASEEYRATGGIDVGRYVMLTQNASNHYYAITGAEQDFFAFRNAHRYDPKLAAIIESSVSLNNRLIAVPDSTQQSAQSNAFIAYQGTGKIADHTFDTNEFEVVQLMPNGQFRFAVYDLSGKLLAAANEAGSKGGKPAKCLWCHEIVLQRPFAARTNAPGDYYTFEAFTDIIKKRMDVTTAYRNTLKQDVDFTKRQDHTFGELLYLSFMEPSAERLALEWDMPVSAVKQKLQQLPTHAQGEHAFLGDQLYDRKDVEAFAPFRAVQVSASDRELAGYEPDLIR